MSEKTLICIRCPLGCVVSAVQNEEGILEISGNGCPRGEEYVRKELTSPTRIVTTTVSVAGGKKAVVSVKTKEDIPKDKIMDCIRALKGIELKAPVHIGDIALENVAGTGVSVIATADISV